MAFSAWSTTAASNTLAATGVACDEGQAPSTVNDGVRELMAQLKAAVVDLTSAQTLTTKTLTSPVISTITNTGTITLPTSTDVLVGRATTDALTNKTLTSPVVNSATGIGQAIVKRKTADESVTSSTTLQDDDHLTFAIAASEEFVGSIFLSVGAALSTTGIKIAITVPTAATLEVIASAGNYYNTTVAPTYTTLRTTTSGTALDFTATGFSNGIGANGGDVVHDLISIHFWVLNSTNAGSVTLQFAQSTSSGTAVTVRKGSHLVAHRVA